MSYTTHTVTAFLLGNRVGPCRITVCRDGPETFHLEPNENLFPPNTALYTTVLCVGTRVFAVYFDKHKHQHEREMAVYAYVAVTMTGRPINVCPEDDLPALLEIHKRVDDMC